ncbi:hypothetical protein FIBSPDRAFT_726097, partial [Athelia psychrophila]
IIYTNNLNTVNMFNSLGVDTIHKPLLTASVDLHVWLLLVLPSSNSHPLA